MIRPPAIDWPRLLGDLAYLLGDELQGTTAREPVPLGTLAAFLAVPRSTLRGWLEGAEPRHNDGEALLLLWAGLAGNAASVPTGAGSLAVVPGSSSPSR